MNSDLFAISYHDIPLSETVRAFKAGNYQDYFEERVACPTRYDSVRFLFFDRIVVPITHVRPPINLLGRSMYGFPHTHRTTNMCRSDGSLHAPQLAEIMGYRVWLATDPPIKVDWSNVVFRFIMGMKIYYEAILGAFPAKNNLGLDKPIARPQGERLILPQGMPIRIELENIPTIHVNNIIFGGAVDCNLIRGIQ